MMRLAGDNWVAWSMVLAWIQGGGVFFVGGMGGAGSTGRAGEVEAVKIGKSNDDLV